ncbi:MAG TPA: efflux RND transporter periplasmic adaptor subunit, partial [Bryobacteraceae bacterium]
MNKYVVRTSLVWICLLLLAAGGVFLYRSYRIEEVPVNPATQPVAAGPAAAPEGIPESTPRMPVQLTSEAMQSIGVTTGVVERKRIANDIRATGTVAIDERLTSYVQVRFRGYIRKVFADAIYQYVRKGEPLFSIYSPDLVETERNYLDARGYQKRLSASTVEGVASGADAIYAGAEERLRQWDVTPRDLAQLKQTGTPIADLVVDSPVSGYLTERDVLPNLYVEPGTRLYTIADLSRVWVYAQISQNDIGELKPGDAAQIAVDAYPTRS